MSAQIATFLAKLEEARSALGHVAAKGRATLNDVTISTTELLQRVHPTDVSARAVGPVRHFLTAYGDAPLLCVELPESPGSELQVGLAAAVDPQANQANRALAFHTEMAPVKRAPSRGSAHGFSAAAVYDKLAVGQHFVIPLVKRAEATLSQDRISVGRARNTDVVLRDGSISKFHAWFEVGTDGSVRIADAGSKNGTLVAGERLPSRDLKEVHYGQAIMFGNVGAFICEPAIFWEAFHLEM